MEFVNLKFIFLKGNTNEFPFAKSTDSIKLPNNIRRRMTDHVGTQFFKSLSWKTIQQLWNTRWIQIQMFFFNFFSEYMSWILLGHWYWCFLLLMMSPLACSIACAWIPQIHLECDTCWLVGGQYGSWTTYFFNPWWISNSCHNVQQTGAPVVWTNGAGWSARLNTWQVMKWKWRLLLRQCCSCIP